jgi:Na+-driven multidrug efflux pump
MVRRLRIAICVFALASASGASRAPLRRSRTALRRVHIAASSAGASGVASTGAGGSEPGRLRPFWPCGDALDKKILALALPATINLAIFPLAGAVDVYWVGRMGEARVLAGMGAANQVFSTLFWLIAFLPSVTTPRVAEAIGKGDRELAATRVCEALALACALGLFGFLLVQLFPITLVSVVTPPTSAIFESALPYLRWRSISFMPALFSAVAFSAFRAEMDAITPLLITLFSNVLNCVLDPILIFNLG